MTKRLGLVPTKVAERGVVSIEPGGVGGQVAFLGINLVDAACHKLPQSHERMRREAQRVGVVVWRREGAPVLQHERMCAPFQGTVGIGHDFVARQCREVMEEGRVDKRGKRKALEEGKSKMHKCIQWEMGAHWRSEEHTSELQSLV